MDRKPSSKHATHSCLKHLEKSSAFHMEPLQTPNMIWPVPAHRSYEVARRIEIGEVQGGGDEMRAEKKTIRAATTADEMHHRSELEARLFRASKQFLCPLSWAQFESDRYPLPRPSHEDLPSSRGVLTGNEDTGGEKNSLMLRTCSDLHALVSQRG